MKFIREFLREFSIRIDYLTYVIRSLVIQVLILGFEEWRFDERIDSLDLSASWLCSCGHYEESGLHCEVCGAEPPWGCDCGFCWDQRNRPEEDYDEWLVTWSDSTTPASTCLPGYAIDDE